MKRFWRRSVDLGISGRTKAAPAGESFNAAALPLFLMHVPKCAGTSVFSYLRQWFDVSEICPLPPHGVWEWHAHEVPGYRLYAGHFSSDFVEEFGLRGTRLIIMRHPLDRVVSLYDFWRSYRWEYIRSSLAPMPNNGPAIAKAGDLTAFLRAEIPFTMAQIYNPVARQLAGRKYGLLWPDEDAIVGTALEALQKFDWIGISESFTDSLGLLSKILGLPKPAVVPRELSTYELAPNDVGREGVRKTEPTGEETKRIMRGNRIDLAIYDEAYRLLRSRLARLD